MLNECGLDLMTFFTNVVVVQKLTSVAFVKQEPEMVVLMASNQHHQFVPIQLIDHYFN